MKRISLSKALKVKNRLAGRLAKVKEVVTQKNSVSKGAEQPDVKSLYNDVTTLTNALLSIKTALYKANAGIQESIYLLAEKKGRIEWLRSINATHGLVPQYERDIEYTAVIRQNELDAEINRLEEEIDDLQDKVDTYNAKTEIEVDKAILSYKKDM